MPQETATARQARQRRDNAARARAYRERLREEGKPTSRETDEAIVEALSFVLRYAVPVDGDAYINVRDLHAAARLILKREGKSKRHATIAVAERLAPRHVHTEKGWMPSARPATAATLFPPKEGGGQWADADLKDLAKIIRHRAGK
jgi:hypothetical protein